MTGAVSGIEPAGRIIGGVLEAIVERGRSLVDARALVIVLQQGDELAVVATSGTLDAELDGLRFPSANTVWGLLNDRLESERTGDEGPPGATLIAPLAFRRQQLGVVIALDRLSEEGGNFDENDERLLEAFAASAATAVATAQSMAEDRLNNTIQAAEHERGRWARELHDETLQGLAALRVSLSSALRRESPAELERAGRDAITQIEVEIEKLRRLIIELRPAALDDIGLEAAVEGLAKRSASQAGISVETRIALSQSRPGAHRMVDTTVYRLVQEGLNNVVRHADAQRVVLDVSESDGRLTILIQDDGVGFEPRIRPEGFGIMGMRERVNLAGGDLTIDSAPGSGTAITATVKLGETALEAPGGGRAKRFVPQAPE